MKVFSKKYPQYIFALYGEGEEAGDTWYKYFQNGKFQECRAIITFPEFNPAMLK